MELPPFNFTGKRKIELQCFSNRKRSQFYRFTAAAILSLGLFLHASVANQALAFVVNTTGDEADAAIGNGVCETAPGNGLCTLRAAIEETNAQESNEAITFDIPQTDPGYDGTSWTIGLLTALPDLGTSMTIEGPRPDYLIVTRDSMEFFRIFNVSSPGTVNLSGLTISNGYVEGENGAGISNLENGTVNISNCTLSDNYAESGNGGGISNESAGAINLTNSTVAGNATTLYGGGLTNQEIGTVTVVGSTFNNNTAVRGGGVTNQGDGVVTVTNSTFFANDGFDGGGIRQTGDGSVEVSNCTVTSNTGRGLSNSGGPFTVKSCIVAQNLFGTGTGDIVGAFDSAGFNLIGTVDGGTGFVQPTDMTGSDDSPLIPMFDPIPGLLGFHGGPTRTVSLQMGSPAIDRGTSEGLTGHLTTDQRGSGFFRTLDDQAIPNAVGGDGTDIGALEIQPEGSTPTPPPDTPTKIGNISTRLKVETGDDVLIGGFIITGTQSKNVVLRALGPSLPVSGALANPYLELHNSAGTIIASNDNWRDTQEAAIEATGIAPTNDAESAIFTTLAPGNYTAIVGLAAGATGIGLVEVYDLDGPEGSTFANLSTRGLVETGDNVMIGGFIIVGGDSINILIRGLGPSLPLTGTLLDPTLELYDADGALIASNDNWRDTQEAEIEATGIPPPNDAEPAIVETLSIGAYTAILSGKTGATGIALVELYQLDNSGAASK